MRDDDEQDKPLPRPQPGVLRSDAAMDIQTRQAQRLVSGRRAQGAGKPAIFGLLRFAGEVAWMWSNAAKDDPWADWFLVRVEQELLEGRESLEHLAQRVKNRLKSAPAVNVALAHSVKPVQVPLRFNNPYAFMGAYLLADFDELVRGILTCRHVGLYDRDTAERTLREAGRIVRRVFGSVSGYRRMAVCREDVRQGTARAARALEKLGPLPQEVLYGTLRAAHAPEVRPVGRKGAAGRGRRDEDDDDWDDDDPAETPVDRASGKG